MILNPVKCPLRDGNILVSYTHPLTKRKVRQTFASAMEADTYKMRLEQPQTCMQINGDSNLTLEELTLYFKQECPESPFFKMRLHLIDFIDTFGHMNIYELRSEMLRNWLDQIQQENKIADTTLRSLKCTLDRLFDFLIEKEIISESPLKSIYYQKTPPNTISRNYLNAYELEKLLSSLQKFSPGYLYPIIKLFSETGAKVTEVIELKWQQVDCVKRTIHFVGTNKSQPRAIKISEELASILVKRQKASGIVFKTYYREPFTRVKLTRAINEFKQRGLYRKPWNLLDLRHSFAMNFLAAGGSLLELQYLMGHENIFDTRRLYGSTLK